MVWVRYREIILLNVDQYSGYRSNLMFKALPGSFMVGDRGNTSFLFLFFIFYLG